MANITFFCHVTFSGWNFFLCFSSRHTLKSCVCASWFFISAQTLFLAELCTQNINKFTLAALCWILHFKMQVEWLGGPFENAVSECWFFILEIFELFFLQFFCRVNQLGYEYGCCHSFESHCKSYHKSFRTFGDDHYHHFHAYLLIFGSHWT